MDDPRNFGRFIRKNRFYLISFSAKRLKKNGKLRFSHERSTNIARGKLGRKQISLIRDPVIAKRLPKRKVVCTKSIGNIAKFLAN